MKISGALVEALINLLKSIGLLEDPEEEVETRRALADLQKTQAQVWVEFVKATTPDSNRVYMVDEQSHCPRAARDIDTCCVRHDLRAGAHPRTRANLRRSGAGRMDCRRAPSLVVFWA
jgi:hypothetical protein